MREVGCALFEALFADRVYGRYTASLQEAARQGEPLRIVLRLRAPELAALPWEAMFDVEINEYLCQREPVVRYVETAQPATPLLIKPPLRILGFVAAPSDLPRLDVGEERRRLIDAVSDLCKGGHVELVWASDGTWPSLQELLLATNWHIVHFVGHGGIDASGGTGVLALEDENTGQESLVSATRFARLLHACRPVPRLVVLNSCQSGEAAADDMLSSTAASLVDSGISAAVAMQFAVTDPAALAFARGFYQALTRGRPVDEAVRLGRIAIDGTSEHTLEWVTPVLYLRTDEARLFTIGPTTQRRSPQDEVSVKESAEQAALHALYVQALAALRTDRPDEAIALLESVLTIDPGYRDARDRRDAARRAQRLAAAYERAETAERAGDWDAAAREYESTLEIEPSYRDTAERLARCRRQQQIASLQDEMRLHARANEWRMVLAVSDDIRALDPQASDVDGLATIARDRLRHEQQVRPDADERARGDAKATFEARPSRGDDAAVKPVKRGQNAIARPEVPAAALTRARAGGAAAVVGGIAVVASIIPHAGNPRGGPDWVWTHLGFVWYRIPVAVMSVVLIAIIGFAFRSNRRAPLVAATGLAFALLGVTSPMSWPPWAPLTFSFWVGACGAAVAAVGAAFASWQAYPEATPAGPEASGLTLSRTSRAAFALSGPLIVIGSLFVLPEWSDSTDTTWDKWQHDSILRYPAAIILLCGLIIALTVAAIRVNRKRLLVMATAVGCLVLGEAVPLIFTSDPHWGSGRWLRIVGAVVAVAGLAAAAARRRQDAPSSLTTR